MTKDKTNIEEIKNEDYIKWVEDKLLLKADGIETAMVRPVLYQVWSNVKALVANDLHKRHADERWYHEYKQDVYRFVGDTVSDAMYMLDKVGALKAQNETLTPKDQVRAECEKYARERVLNQYSDEDKGYYTGYCDRDGVKIYTGDVVRFEKTYPEGGIWEAEVVFDDGCPTVKTFENVKQVKNPDNWDKEHDWIKSRWWSVEVGYGEGGDWNCFRTPLNKLAGVFESSDEFFKARERFNKRYGKFHSNDNLYRPLPIKVVQNFKKEAQND